MMLGRQTFPARLGPLVALLAAAACTDRMTPTNPRQLTSPGQAQRTISDGAHGSNPEVFFLPPMVGNPNAVSTFNDAFQPGLPASIVITDMTPGNSFTPITLPMSVDPGSSFYAVNWDTKATALNINDSYRINVKVGSKIIAFADVDLVANGSGLKRVDTQDFIGLVDGRTLPIKVRINNGWNCVNRASCVTQVVPSSIPNGGTVIVVTNDRLNSVAFTDTWNNTGQNIIVTIEDVTNQLSTANGGPGCSEGVTVMLSREHCVRLTLDPKVTLSRAITIGTCIFSPGDKRQLLGKYDIDEPLVALEDAPPPVTCPEGFGMIAPSRNPLVRLASAALSGLGWAIGLKTAYAFDVGVGATIDAGTTCCSLFAPIFPAEMFKSAGDNQTGSPGSVLPVQPTVRVSALHDVGEGGLPAAVTGLTLTCAVVGASGGLVVGDGTAPNAPAVDNKDGTYTCPAWQISRTAGANTLTVTAANLDPSFMIVIGGEQETLPGQAVFTAQGAAAPHFGDVVGPANGLAIGGPAGQVNVTIVNPGRLATGIGVHGFIKQGNATSDAGQALVVCGDGSPGVLPSGTCQIIFSALAPSDGTLVDGSATLELDLQQTSGTVTTTLDTKLLTVTLFTP